MLDADDVLFCRAWMAQIGLFAMDTFKLLRTAKPPLAVPVEPHIQRRTSVQEVDGTKKTNHLGHHITSLIRNPTRWLYGLNNVSRSDDGILCRAWMVRNALLALDTPFPAPTNRPLIILPEPRHTIRRRTPVQIMDGAKRINRLGFPLPCTTSYPLVVRPEPRHPIR